MSSALVGSLALASAAVAETKITGSATFTYAGISGGTALDSVQGYGSEVQLDIANSGDLNIGGLKYKAGFSLEQDADESAIDAREGNYFSIVSGKTEVMFNIDKAPNLSASATPRVSTSLNTQLTSMGTTIYDYSPGAQAQQESFNTALIQGTDVGTFAVVYTPKFADTGGKNDRITRSDQTGNSALDVIYSGNLGMDGLKVQAGYSKLQGQTGTDSDVTAKQLGASYNFGQIAAGVTRNTTENTKAATSGGVGGAVTSGREVTSDEFGITFAANDRLSFGLQYAETDVTSGTADEEITSAAVAYNLGGASLELYYVQIENLGGSAVAKDVEKAAVRVSTKF